jgi:hypothetical protein
MGMLWLGYDIRMTGKIGRNIFVVTSKEIAWQELKKLPETCADIFCKNSRHK